MGEMRVLDKTKVAVVGAGIAGCAAALELADAGVGVALVEKQEKVGGRVRQYGCKATDRCHNCGLCLAGGLWEKVENHPDIEIIPQACVQDLAGRAGQFALELHTPEGPQRLPDVQAVLVATGFEGVSTGISAHLQIEGTQGVLTGTELEKALLVRGKNKLFDSPPQNVAFIQCFASRDKKEDAFFCSRVCCAYSTRAARVVRQYYPDCGIAFFYMELQAVSNTDAFAELQGLGVEFIPCRPLRIRGGSPASVQYEQLGKGMVERPFDLVVLSEGVHPAADAATQAELFGLSQDTRGFLRAAAPGAKTGVWVAGCARGPQSIEEAGADGRTAAREILAWAAPAAEGRCGA